MQKALVRSYGRGLLAAAQCCCLVQHASTLQRRQAAVRFITKFRITRRPAAVRLRRSAPPRAGHVRVSLVSAASLLQGYSGMYCCYRDT